MSDRTAPEKRSLLPHILKGRPEKYRTALSKGEQTNVKNDGVSVRVGNMIMRALLTRTCANLA